MTTVDFLAADIDAAQDIQVKTVTATVRTCWICRKPATHGNECGSCNDTSIAIDKAHERREQ